MCECANVQCSSYCFSSQTDYCHVLSINWFEMCMSEAIFYLFNASHSSTQDSLRDKDYKKAEKQNKDLEKQKAVINTLTQVPAFFALVECI